MSPEQEAWAARKARKAARDRARHHAQSPYATAAVMAQAEALLPDIIAAHGDTPALQYERRAALAADVDAHRKAAA